MMRIFPVIVILVFSIAIVSCINASRDNQGIILKKFNKDSYYQSTKEVKEELYRVLDSLLAGKNNRDMICDALKSYSIDNLSADIMIDVKKQRIDSILLMGLLTFDSEKNPSRIDDSVVLVPISRMLMIKTHYGIEDGLYGARIQLEKLCQ